MQTIDILGTPYLIQKFSGSEDDRMIDNDGFCDFSTKEIGYAEGLEISHPGDQKNLELVKQQVLRHEIVHAFMYESGLNTNSEFAVNETLIDWIAIQFPKMLKAMKTCNSL